MSYCFQGEDCPADQFLIDTNFGGSSLGRWLGWFNQKDHQRETRVYGANMHAANKIFAHTLSQQYWNMRDYDNFLNYSDDVVRRGFCRTYYLWHKASINDQKFLYDQYVKMYLWFIELKLLFLLILFCFILFHQTPFSIGGKWDGTVRLYGFTYDSTINTVQEFCQNLNPIPSRILLEKDSQGRHNGNVFIQFYTFSDAEEAIRRDKRVVKSIDRYIDAEPSSNAAFRKALLSNKRIDLKRGLIAPFPQFDICSHQGYLGLSKALSLDGTFGGSNVIVYSKEQNKEPNQYSQGQKSHIINRKCDNNNNLLITCTENQKNSFAFEAPPSEQKLANPPVTINDKKNLTLGNRTRHFSSNSNGRYQNNFNNHYNQSNKIRKHFDNNNNSLCNPYNTNNNAHLTRKSTSFNSKLNLKNYDSLSMKKYFANGLVNKNNQKVKNNRKETGLLDEDEKNTDKITVKKGQNVQQQKMFKNQKNNSFNSNFRNHNISFNRAHNNNSD